MTIASNTTSDSVIVHVAPNRRGRTAAASRSGGSGVRLRNYVHHHVVLLFSGMGQLGRTPGSALFSCLVVGLTLALPLGLLAMIDSLRSTASTLASIGQVSVYIKKEVSAEAVAALAARLRERPEVESVTHVTPQAGLEELKGSAQLEGVLAALDENPLPHVLVVQPRAQHQDRQALSSFSDFLRSDPDVELVQWDADWVGRFNALLDLAQRITLGLGAFLALAVMLNIANTVRLALEGRREEIEVMRLVGASKAFIRRPFLYAGLWLGVLGSLLAWWLVNLALHWLQPEVTALAARFGTTFQLDLLGWASLAPVVAVSAATGWLGARWAVGRHLRLVNSN